MPLLIGYDVESLDVAVIEKAVKGIIKVHTELEAHATLFLLGKSVEAGLEYIKLLLDYKGLFDLQQHTYSHVLLKTVLQPDYRKGEGVRLVRAGSLEAIKEDVKKASELLEQVLNVKPLGLRGPWGYYRGLSDRPDILEVLHDLDIRFTSTHARDANDWQPVPFDVQPYWYTVQGFPDVLEIPVQGWQDCIWRDYHGWEKRREFITYLCSCLDQVKERNLVWGFATHDWSSVRGDPEMEIMRELIVYAQEKGIEINTYRDYYERQKLKI